MLVNWLFLLICPGWSDLILNPQTGKVSQKNLFGVMGFYLGTVLTATIALVQLGRGERPDTSVIALLTVNGLGLTAAKIWQNYTNRMTATDAGQPLAVPPPAAAPPEVMPQVPNPNANAAQSSPVPASPEGEAGSPSEAT